MTDAVRRTHAPRIVFDRVWKKFAVGDHHDSLRDFIPAAFARLARRSRRSSHDREFWALKDVTFEVRAGRALGIIGPNGAGKSTALKLLTRILKPTQGSAHVDGRTGALIEVAAGFHPDLTGRENVYLQGAIMGMRRSEIGRRFDEIVEFAGVGPFVDTPVKRYSSGMNARLGFSIAAHLSPDVLLIDEVLAVGDMAFQEKCHARMREFQSQGVAIVFVSHHLPAIAQLCDEVLLLDHGEIVRSGRPADVIGAYCRGQAATSNPTSEDVTISATLRTRVGLSATDTFDIAAGERVTLDVTVEFHTTVSRATIGIVVRDIARELYVYGASSDFVGIPPINAAAGDRRDFRFTFDANLTRGLYAVEVNVVDSERHSFLAIARGIRHFQIDERVSYDGIANLYLKGRESVPVYELTHGTRASCE